MDKAVHQNTVRTIAPDISSIFGYAWEHMWKNFLDLLIIAIVVSLLSIPTGGMSIADEIDSPFGLLLFFPSLVYTIFIFGPIEFGAYYVFLKAARNEKVRLEDVFVVFKNYINVLVASLLSGLLILVGILFCIVPGIFIACKLAFVPFLVVDKKMDGVAAIKESWNLTNDFGMTILIYGILSTLLFILGFLLCGVGILIAFIWVYLALASLYIAVLQHKKKLLSIIDKNPKTT
jgi:hypothetical protein